MAAGVEHAGAVLPGRERAGASQRTPQTRGRLKATHSAPRAAAPGLLPDLAPRFVRPRCLLPAYRWLRAGARERRPREETHRTRHRIRSYTGPSLPQPHIATVT